MGPTLGMASHGLVRGPGKGHLAGGSTADNVGSIAFCELVELRWGKSRLLRHEPGKALSQWLFGMVCSQFKTGSSGDLIETRGGAVRLSTGILYLRQTL